MSISFEIAADTEAGSSLDGIWRRGSLSLDGRTLPQDSQVTWAQLGPWFVDLRSPDDNSSRAAAFSGRIIWNPPRVRFLRDLDLDPAAPNDTAVLEIVEDEMMERGEVTIEGRTVRYVETWTRRERSTGPRIVLEGRITSDAPLSGRLIQSDDMLVAMVTGEPGGVQAIALETSADGWRLLHQIGALEPPPSGGVVSGDNWAGLRWMPAA